MAYLLLNDGTIFEGKMFGYDTDVIGEVVFSTGMTGYQELLTDPSYYGQIAVMTYPLVGNYGVNAQDVQSLSPKVKGFIVHEYCEHPSNWMCENTLEEYLKENKITGFYGIDTRELTRRLRNSGTMNGIICKDYPTEKDKKAVAEYVIDYPVKSVSVEKAYDIENSGKKVAVIDYGIKRSMIAILKKRGYHLRVFPHNATYKEIMDFNPDGIFLSSGPGDPKDNKNEIEVIKQLIGKKPIFGICLGHQLLALAYGGDTVKLKYGHRGVNHPVKDLNSGHIYITSQNHGYAVVQDTLKGKGVMSHVNGNDGTCEGMLYDEGMTLSVQFHPEANPGPRDTEYLFERFNQMMQNSD